MELKKISIKYRDLIDITVPGTFLFIYTLRSTDEVVSDEEYRTKGKYIYDTVNTITASDILHHNYPKGAIFTFNWGENLEICVPIDNLECKCIGEYKN